MSSSSKQATTKQTKVAVSSLHSGRTIVHKIAPKSRERASADVVPRAIDLRGAQRARNVVPDSEHQRLLVVVYGKCAVNPVDRSKELLRVVVRRTTTKIVNTLALTSI